MEKVKKLIQDNLNDYPEFEYHLKVIEKAQKNLLDHPDIAIDCAKSLIEGVSKNILKHLQKDVVKPEIIEKKPFKKLVEEVLNNLSEWDNSIEIEFAQAFGHLIHNLGEIRNKRGDISHGHLSPKLEESDVEFAEMIVSFSACVSAYLLKSFYKIDFSSRARPPYEDYGKFNDYFDEQGPSIGAKTYSQLVYEYDYFTYQAEYDEYSNNEDLDQ